MIPSLPFRLVPNPRPGVPGTVVLPASGFRRARGTLAGWPGRAPVAIASLPEIAEAAGVAALHCQDGSEGVASLGLAYAASRLVEAARARRGAGPTITLCCAGGQGMAVARAARHLGARCVVFSQAGDDAAARYGADVRTVGGDADDAVRAAAAAAAREGWLLVSGTSWPGHTEAPRDAMQGVRVLAEEALSALPAPPTHCLAAGGTGEVAAAMSVQLRAAGGDVARLVIVEADPGARLLARAGGSEPTGLPGDPEGPVRGAPALLAWAELERAAHAFVAVPDDAVAAGTRLLAERRLRTGGAAVALAGLLLTAADPAARRVLGLQAGSRVLLFGAGGEEPALHGGATSGH